jgi:GT2 family glycosyltransferase
MQELESKLGVKSKWYVRSNGCKDETVSYLQTLGDKVAILSKDHNRDNFAQGVNSLALMAQPDVSSGDMFLLLNNDIVFKESNSLIKMYNLLKQHDAGIVGAKLRFNDGNKLQHAGVIFSSRYNNMPWHFRAGEEDDEFSKKNREFQAVTGALFLTPCDLFFKVGMLDENFYWAFEDIAYNLMVRQQGKKILLCGDTNIEHGESVSLKKNPVNKLMMGPNVKRFKEKYGSLYQIDHDHYLNDKNYNVI